MWRKGVDDVLWELTRRIRTIRQQQGEDLLGMFSLCQCSRRMMMRMMTIASQSGCQRRSSIWRDGEACSSLQLDEEEESGKRCAMWEEESGIKRIRAKAENLVLVWYVWYQFTVSSVTGTFHNWPLTLTLLVNFPSPYISNYHSLHRTVWYQS